MHFLKTFPQPDCYLYVIRQQKHDHRKKNSDRRTFFEERCFTIKD